MLRKALLMSLGLVSFIVSTSLAETDSAASKNYQLKQKYLQKRLPNATNEEIDYIFEGQGRVGKRVKIVKSYRKNRQGEESLSDFLIRTDGEGIKEIPDLTRVGLPKLTQDEKEFFLSFNGRTSDAIRTIQKYRSERKKGEALPNFLKRMH